MANFFGAVALIGGADGALDDILDTDISDGDGAIVIDATNNILYAYTYDSSSSASEASPDVIKPDSNAGNGRWLLVKAYTAGIQLVDGAAITEISTDGTFAGNSDTAVPTEKASKTYMDSLSGTTTSLIGGFVSRPQFTYHDADEIKISAGRYHHDGTSAQIVYWNSELTFQLGPAGSNADSSAIGTSNWMYIYLDDSAIVTAGTNLLTAAEFLASTTAPTWSHTKHGFYNGEDRCIFAVYINSSGNIFIWRHDGGRYVMLDESCTERSLSDLDSTRVTVTLDYVPAFSTKAQLNLRSYANGDTTTCDLFCSVAGSANDGIYVGLSKSADGAREYNTFDMFCSASQQIDIWHSVDGGHKAGVNTNGWYLPRGM